MKTRKIIAMILAIVLAASALACLAACNKGGNGDGKVDGTKPVTVQVGPNPETLDPALNSAVDGGNMLITLFETLLIIDQDNKVQPGQAEKYEVSDDGLTWTFTMRDGLKWSDGTDLNAKDFEYTFKRIADTKLAAPYGETVLGMIDGYQDAIGNPDKKGKTTTKPDPEKLNVKASDDGKTLTIKLAYPCSYFDKIVAFGTMSPVQKATVEANGDKWATDPKTYVCNGPYMIESWTPGERIVCKKNPNYKGGWDSAKIVTETLNFLLLEDSSASYTAYTSGEAQMIKDVPTEEIPGLTKAADGGDFYVDTNLGTYYLNMNLKKAPFDNINVRKALNLAIDRAYIANTIMQGTYTPAYNFVGPGIVDAEDGKMFFDVSKENNGGKCRVVELTNAVSKHCQERFVGLHEVIDAANADGCQIEGSVEGSILFPGVKVGKGSQVKNCILFKNTVVEEGVTLGCVIADKDVHIRRGGTLIGHESYPLAVSKGSIV